MTRVSELGDVPVAATEPDPLREAAQRIVFFAEVDDDAITGFLSTPPDVKAAVTADWAYRSYMLDRLIAEAKEQERVIHPWCDCRLPDGDPPGTPFSEAQRMQADYELAEPIGQAESVAEYKHAIFAGTRIVIGNPRQLKEENPLILRDAIGRVNRGTLAFIGEVLEPNGNYSAEGIDIASMCFYTGLDEDRYQPLASFFAVMPAWSLETCCVYHGRACRPADWRLIGR